MCYFHWLIQRLPWPFNNAENQVGRVHRTECWEEEGHESDAIALLSEMDAGEYLPGNPPLGGATHFSRNGLVKM